MRFLYTLAHPVFIIIVLFQLYLETVQDLLAPGRDNITIVEDPKNVDVCLPGVTMVQVHDRGSFVQLLETGEVNRFASNTQMNTESSRSHAILLVIKCEGNYFMS